MKAADDIVAELLRQSLAAWNAELVLVRSGDGEFVLEGVRCSIRIERAPPGLPFRWIVSIGDRRRGASSLVGVLRHLRTALDPGYIANRVRIAPAPLVPQ